MEVFGHHCKMVYASKIRIEEEARVMAVVKVTYAAV